MLSKKGLEQAKELKDQAPQQFDLVITSDLKRTKDTAEIAFEGRCPIIVDRRLREANYGEWNGTKNSFYSRVSEFVEKPFPGGESYIDVENRVRALIDECKEKYQGKHIAFVSHKAPQLAMQVILKDRSWNQAFAEDWRKVGKWQPGWDYSFD